MDQSVMARFMAKVDTSGTCWLWTASKRNGYGKLNIAGKTRDAHRLSYEHFVGPILHGLEVLHRCDVRDCVRPEHLFLGTQADNVADMIAKGRQRKWGTRPALRRPNIRCEHCGTSFHPSSSSRRFCSNSCSNLAVPRGVAA